MDTQQISVPSHAPSRVPGSAAPSSGVVHINSRHTSRFTVVGNHLAQHRKLSLLAIGLGLHIQSLPAGAKVGIKTLAERFPESEARIAAALRELEAHGYLRRTRERLPDGRVVTRTCSYNQPGATPHAPTAPKPQPRPRPRPGRPVPAPEPCAALTPVASPAPASQPPAPLAPHRPAAPPPPLPAPRAAGAELLRTAADLLAGLRRDTPQLVLSERDVDRLSPAVAAWLEREATPETIRRALTADLPMPLKHPANLLRHRLVAFLPPPLPLAAVRREVTPFQTCDGCERAFRSPAPGHCRDCRTDDPHPPVAQTIHSKG